MNQTHKQQSQQKLKISLISKQKREFNLKKQEKIYTKTIKPIVFQVKPSSLKNLDLATTLNFELIQNESFQDNKSCCCLDCGINNKKTKHLQKKFIYFQTKMSVLKKQRLSKKFQNAVICIIYLIKKWKKIRQQERAKRLFRFKTKVFDNQTTIPGQSNQNVYSYINSQIQINDQVNFNQQVQSIQAQIIDQKHKQRLSVKHYLEQKLNNNKIQSSNTLPTITYSKYHNSISNQLLKPIKILKTVGDEQNTQKKEYNLLNYNSSLINSPYKSQFGRYKQLEQSISQVKSSRSATKSISSQTFFPYKQNIHKFRQNIVKKMRNIV